MASKSDKNIKLSISLRAKDFDTSLASSKKVLRAFEKDGVEGLKRLGVSTKDLANAQKILKKQYDTASIGSRERAKADYDLQRIEKILIATGNQKAQVLNKETAAVKKNTAAVKNNAAAKKQQKKVSFGEAAAGVAGAAVLTAGASAAISGYTDFEAPLNRVIDLLKLTDEEYQRVKQTVLEVAGDSVFSSAQVADGLKVITKAGLDLEQSLTALLASIRAAAAAESDVAAAANMGLGIMKAYGKTAEDLPAIYDTIAETANSVKVEFEDLGESFKYINGIAGPTKKSFNQMSAAVGILADHDILGSMAGTSIRTILLEAGNAASESRKRMADLGVQFDDTRFKSEGLAYVITALKDAGLDADRAMNVFGKTASGAMGVLFKTGREELDAFTKRLELAGGTSQSLADGAFRGLSGAFKDMSSSWESLSNMIIDSGIGEILEGFVRALTSLINLFKDLPKPVKTFIGVLAGLTTAIVAVMGGISAFTFAINGLKAAFAALNMSLGVVGLIAVAIAAVVTAIYYLWKNWDKVVGWMKKAWELLVMGFQLSWNRWVDLFINGITGIALAIDKVFGTSLTSLVDDFRDKLKFDVEFNVKKSRGRGQQFDPMRGLWHQMPSSEEEPPLFPGMAWSQSDKGKTSANSNNFIAPSVSSDDGLERYFKDQEKRVVSGFSNLFSAWDNERKGFIALISNTESNTDIELIPQESIEEWAESASFKAAKEFTERMANQLNESSFDMMSAFVTDQVDNIFQAIGSGDWNDFGANVLSSFGGFLSQFGSLLISWGIAKEALRTSLGNVFAGGVQAIIAGAALVAVGGAMKGLANRAKSGGGATGISTSASTSTSSGGGSNMGFSRAGSIINGGNTGMANAANGIQIFGEFKQRGRDLVAVINQQGQKARI